MKSRRFKSLLFVPALLLAGCTALTVASVVGFNPMDYFGTPVNMREKDYAAADYMISRASGFIRKTDTIRATPLLDYQEPRIVTLFGKQVSQQVSERLVALGYNVDMRDVWTEVDPAWSPRQTPAIPNPDYLLTGDYVRKTSQLDITLRLQDAATGMERASFSFTVPRSGDVRRAATPKAAIYKTDGGPAAGDAPQGISGTPFSPSPEPQVGDTFNN